ncbi:hypothetical protein KDK77_04495, partial [bacterium]|nr:hypothetical protein [bacterium]
EEIELSIDTQQTTHLSFTAENNCIYSFSYSYDMSSWNQFGAQVLGSGSPVFLKHRALNTNSAFYSIASAPADNPQTSRSFYLGFTLFPYDVTAVAQSYIRQHIAEDADIVALHFDGGVPWEESLRGTLDFSNSATVYNANFIYDIVQAYNSISPGHKVYLAITPINIDRTGLAYYRGASENMPLDPSDPLVQGSLTHPWHTYRFNHDNVKTAFLNYALTMIALFQPDYVAIGIESNLLLTTAAGTPAEVWSDYLELHQYIYTSVKTLYPDLPVFCSLLGAALLDGYRAEDDHALQIAGLQQIMPYSDFFAVSLYPYLTVYLAESIPATLYDDLFSLSTKPIVVTETGYPAETFSVLNGSIVFNGTEQKQLDYFTDLLAYANQHDFKFIINFVLRDYDQLFDFLVSIGQGTDTQKLWRDTGLYNHNGAGRPALQLWKDYQQQPVRN